MKMLAPPSLRSMRGLPCCMLRMTSAPRMRSNHCAVASGSGLRRWTWSQVYVDILVFSPQLVGLTLQQASVAWTERSAIRDGLPATCSRSACRNRRPGLLALGGEPRIEPGAIDHHALVRAVADLLVLVAR